MTLTNGLYVHPRLRTFVEEELLAGLNVDVPSFWQGFHALLKEFAPKNRLLLEKRGLLQRQIDARNIALAGNALSAADEDPCGGDIGKRF